MAKNSKQVAETILRYTVDEKSVRRAMAANEEIEDLFGQTSKAELTAADAAQSLNQRFAELARAKALSEITAETIRLGNQTSDWGSALSFVSDELASIGASADEIERIADALAEAEQASAGIDIPTAPTASAGGGGALGTLDNAAGKGAQILSGLGQGEAANAVGLIGDAVSAVAAFGPVAGVATLAGGALVAITSQISAAWEKATQEAEDYAARQDALAQLTASGATSADYQRQIDDAEATRQGITENTSALQAYKNQIDSLDETIANLVVDLTDPAIDYDPDNPERRAQTQALLDQARAAQQQLVGGISEAFDGQLTSYDALSLAIEENQTKIDEYTAQLTALEAEMYSAGVAENDRRQAIENAQAEADRQVQQQIDIEREADALTAEQRQARIQDLIAEREALQRALSEQGTSIEYQKQLQEQLEGVNARIDWFGENLDTTADRLDRVVKAQERLNEINDMVAESTNAVLEANTNVAEAYESALEATNAYNKALFEHEAALNEIETEDLAQREELQAKAADERIKAETATAKKIADINKKTNAAISNAIAARDVLAYIMTKEAQKEQLQQEEDANKERERELQDTLRKQLADQEKANREAIARENARWDQERATRVRANQQALVDVQNAENSKRNLQQNSNVAQLALMEMRARGEASIYQSMASTAAFYLNYMAGRSAAAWSAMATAINSSASLGGGGSRTTPTAFADGGDVTRTGLALVHEGERIYTPIEPAGRRPLPSNTTNQSFGGSTFNIVGATRQQIINEVVDKLHDLLDQAGLIPRG